MTVVSRGVAIAGPEVGGKGVFSLGVAVKKYPVPAPVKPLWAGAPLPLLHLCVAGGGVLEFISI